MIYLNVRDRELMSAPPDPPMYHCENCDGLTEEGDLTLLNPTGKLLCYACIELELETTTTTTSNYNEYDNDN